MATVICSYKNEMAIVLFICLYHLYMSCMARDVLDQCVSHEMGGYDR